MASTHARTQGIVKGKLIVGELPPHLAQSLFSTPAEYPIAMRYSTEPGDPGPDDRIPQPRGLGMKVFNVRGEMFDIGKDYPTQDIEFNSTQHLILQMQRQQKKSLTFTSNTVAIQKSFTSIWNSAGILISRKHATKLETLTLRYTASEEKGKSSADME
jgi:catalase